MSVQICVLRIDGYGPWTLELGSDREHRLQSLQASLYAALQDAFSEHGALVFQNRADELIALTNSLSADSHASILEPVRRRFDSLRLAAGVGCAPGALDASKRAGEAMAYPEALTGAAGNPCADGGEVAVLHMDVDGLSARRPRLSPYEITAKMYGLYAQMAGFFIGRGSLAFFMGGDNFMVVSGGQNLEGDAADFVKVSDSLGLGLNCGIGRGRTAREAASGATRSLDGIRKMRKDGGKRVRVHEAA